MMKKAQISSTLTWIVAFLIIVFLMILFVGSTVVLSAKRGINIGIGEYDSYKPRSISVLIRILNTPTMNEKTTVKDIIKQWNVAEGQEREKLKQEAISTITRWDISQSNECYIFSAFNEESMVSTNIDPQKQMGYETSTGKPDSRNSIEVIFYGKTPKVTNENKEAIRTILLRKSEEIYLVSDKGKIKINFYVGEC